MENLEDKAMRLLEKSANDKIIHIFPLSGGLSGARVFLASFDTVGAHVIKTGSKELIDREKRNFRTLKNTGAYNDLKSNLVEKILDLKSSKSTPLIVYKYAGRVPEQNESPPQSFLDCAELYFKGENPDFINQITDVDRDLANFRATATVQAAASYSLPQFLEPDWKLISPIISTAEALSSFSFSLKEVREVWESWKDERKNPVQLRLERTHGDLRCNNIVYSDKKLFLIDFGNVREAPNYLDLIHLEIDIILRMQVDNEIRNRIVRAAFDPYYWQKEASPDWSQEEKIIQQFRWLFMLRQVRHSATDLVRRDFYVAYLVDLLRRARHWEDYFLSVQSRHLLWWIISCCLEAIKNVDRKPNALPSSLEEYSVLLRPDVPRGMGLLNWTFGDKENGDTENEKRNEKKKKAIASSRGQITLFAHSGHAYLAEPGIHFGELCRYLDNSENSFLAILLNPFSEAAIQLYLNWIRAYEKRSQTFGSLSVDGKFRIALQSYQGLRNIYGDRIRVMMTSFDFSCTVLWTTEKFFFEPYFRLDAIERARMKLNSYEMEYDSRSAFGQVFGICDGNNLTHLDFFMSRSITYEKWKENLNNLHEKAKENLEVLEAIGEINSSEREFISIHLHKYLDEENQ